MKVKDGMSTTILTIRPRHTLRKAAEMMTRRQIGSAIVVDPDQPGPGILTERDVLLAVGRGQDVDSETVADHLTPSVITADPEWSLEEAAATMIRGGFRHLVVAHRGDVVGMLSVRDVVRCWTEDGATSDMPEGAPSS